MQNKSQWASCIEWALDTLQRLGYSIQNATPETILQTPWSLHTALAEYRLLTSVGSLQQLLGQGRLAKQLRVWLTQTNNIGDVN
jgi:hypothetical protein